MANGNNDPGFLLVQTVSKEIHEVHKMVNKLGQMSAQQAQLLSGMNNIMNNLTGLSMLLNCMQVAMLENMDEYAKGEVMETYQELCKENGVKPLTGEIASEDGVEGEE